MSEYNQIASWIGGYGDSNVLNYKDMEDQFGTIETSKIKQYLQCPLCLNRTYKELKLEFCSEYVINPACLNRTYKELKLV